ncbi:helix-turn-helix domain-containing protein [Chryseobacterium sp. Bi04]|jgi:DNA-binding HxlR family transcriptional regulator|uniref:winged helix-turn-helix transcriptional regulator n=1 Tax=Chryseobacterium sp. Bi04 TaxID=2822345 RepID=UPI001DBBE00D|nr:helix-turn-helix domain-containing protein [Chryseobacterium sp. Bi04]CAH0193977.1 putative HTH-type transcriptional regulator YtcD [Chryseobacterium sp. Bi04]
MQTCKQEIAAIKDTIEIVSGKWKLHILGTLARTGKMRFMDLLRDVDGIATKMLSKELQDMEMNHLISRTVVRTKPITVEYNLTDLGRTLIPIIGEITKWGIDYRRALYEDSRSSM